jgi:GTP-binding protein HflX
MLGADFAKVTVDVGAGNGRVLAYLAAHAEVFRQECRDNRIHVHCYLPRHLVHHIQDRDVRIHVLDNGAVTKVNEVVDAADVE